ncbi:DUF3108 domain-containing protein [Ideonella paludis]|uniref:DUF3108 domain-containing protein n=1 Tax=Ideonella paludis TaxID=1233411 RepID=A0ABS5E2P8_9BURK|nr:DUF3108 domain-containing protein [Ideonella paludis]MBQ0937589.1 DUF3108 domain-containing protein [Ideonella paludis]
MVEPWRAVIASRSLPPGLARGGRLAAVVLGVVLLHGAVLNGLRLPWGALARQPPPEPMQVLALPAERLAQTPARPSAFPAQRTPAPKPVPQAPRPQLAQVQGTAQPLAAAPVARPEPVSAAPEDLPLPAPSAGPRPGRAAPRAAAEVPHSLTLRYAAQRGAAQGQAQIDWQTHDERFVLSVKVDVPGTPAIDWLSRGQLSSQGLAPERMVEQHKQRAVRAVNFQRDKGLISFSGSPRSAALGPQAQDRASWLVQLWAWARALPSPPRTGQTLRFAVASPRGDVDEWTFEVHAPEVREVAGHRVSLTPLVRSPQRPYDLRVTVWLTQDAAQWPAGVSWGVEPGGMPLVLWLAEWPDSE